MMGQFTVKLMAKATPAQPWEPVELNVEADNAWAAYVRARTQLTIEQPGLTISPTADHTDVREASNA